MDSSYKSDLNKYLELCAEFKGVQDKNELPVELVDYVKHRNHEFLTTNIRLLKIRLKKKRLKNVE